MKRILCLVLSVVLLTTSFSVPCLASADDAVSTALDISLDTVLDFAKCTFNNYVNSQCKKVAAARSFYFYIILNDSYSSGLTVFDETGLKFSDDILNFYYEQYKLTKTGTDIYNSNGDVFIQAAGFSAPWSLSMCAFGTDIEKVGTSYIGDWDKPYFKQYYQTELARYLLNQGYTGVTDPNPGKSGLEIAPGYVSSEEFSSSLALDEELYTPKSEVIKVSYKNDDVYQHWVNFKVSNSNNCYSPTIMYDGAFYAGDYSSLYFTPFCYYDGLKYYGKTQFKICFDNTEAHYLRLYYWDIIDGSESDASELFSSSVDLLGYNYIQLFIQNNVLYFHCFKSFSDFYNNYTSNGVVLQAVLNSDKNNLKTLMLSDYSGTSFYYDLLHSSSHEFRYDWSTHSDSCLVNDNCDIGLLCSETPISFSYFGLVDSTKIPSGQIITINGGDTIYNYTITNPETGESNELGDYITNNYTYVTNNYVDSGSSGSGSGVSGNVTVGGSIDVGGSVGVDINVSVPDININVNDNGGAGGSGSSVNPDDFTDASSVDLDKYYDYAVEESNGFQKFLSVFFGFLPAELLALILFAVAIAIICRVFGR